MITTINEFKIITEAVSKEHYLLFKGENIIDNFNDKVKAIKAFKDQPKPADNRPSTQISLYKKIK